MADNVRSAAAWGAARGARGLLVTDWGDRGHLQPPFVSRPGFLVAAEHAWNPNPRLGGTQKLIELVSRHALPGRDGNGVCLLGMAASGFQVSNASPLSLLLTTIDAPFPPDELRALKPEWLEEAGSMARLAEGAASGGELVSREMRWAAGLMSFASDLGLERCRAPAETTLAALAEGPRRTLAARLRPLIEGHRALWLERSRPGGLERSVRWLERVLECLEG